MQSPYIWYVFILYRLFSFGISNFVSSDTTEDGARKTSSIWCYLAIQAVQTTNNRQNFPVNGYWPFQGPNVRRETNCYDKDLHDFWLILFISVYWYWSHSDSRLIFLPASGPIVLLTRAQLAVVTQSCALLYITAHCDLLLQWHYCSSDAYCLRYSIVLLQYLSQACWVLWSPRLDFFHRTVISTLVAANRLEIPTPLLPEPSHSYSLQRL